MDTTSRQFALGVFLSMLVLFVSATTVRAQTTTFTYQGRLSDGANAANGSYDLGFALFDAATGGTQIGTAQTRAAVNVSNGVFTVQLDFGAAASPGANRFLEIAVKRPTDANFTTLMPRQQITSTPYAIRALNAANADTATTATNAQQLGGTAAGNFTQNDSQVFVRNQTTQQTSANFNIGATGTANIFNATTQYNIDGSRILSSAGDSNLFAGVGAGSANTGVGNSFVGSSAGNQNTTGNNNSFFGAVAGNQNTTGGSNSFVGSNAGSSNTTGGSNSFVGTNAGQANTTGFTNSFFGQNAGNINTTGANNTIIGQNANVSVNNLTFATALGSGATVSQSNTIALGRSDGSDKVVIYGLGAANTNTTLCRNSLNQIATCTGIITLAKPETADAQTAQIEAMQTQIKTQAAQLAEQKTLIDALRALLCSTNATAAVCKANE